MILIFSHIFLLIYNNNFVESNNISYFCKPDFIQQTLNTLTLTMF